MDVATALAVAQTLFATLQCAEVRKLCSIIKYESDLEKLIQTVDTIKSALQDADSKFQELTNGGQNWVNNLKDAVYNADDLLDEFNTVAHQLKRMPGGNILKKVRRFFSSSNQLIFAFNMSKEIKNLREKLDGLAKNRSDFGFSELYKPMKRREETCSYVYEQDIIGRDADKEAIVDLLLKDDLESNISFVTIVGIGGLGKTTLAQLVFSDHRIKEAFIDEMYWVCVSLNFDTKDILGKMFRMNELGFEDLHKEVRNRIQGKRFLLVLDDVWYENGRKWDELKNILILGGRGSRILVTSRSRKVAGAIGNYPIHELLGLSKEDSWALFKNISIGQREDEAVTGLVEIGRDIVKKCVNVPLSIRVVASLLRDQDIATWQSLRSNDLANMCGGEDGIMPTLMFSYYHLPPGIKSCFSFCSLFPEDYEIGRLWLIYLWMAQGYLVPSSKNESMEDVGEKYISILLHRCFFQDIERNEFGEVESFKMHDLMHELARNVAAKESLTLTACTDGFEGKVRHLYIDSVENLTTWFRSSSCPTKTLRTCLKYSVSTTSGVDAIISNCSRLRVLALSLNIGNLPDKLGKLSHLRLLDLSCNEELEMLPKSITKLHNLQLLRLSGCRKLKELPEDTSKLINLRVLDISECWSLTHMPAWMGELLQLRYLNLSSSYSYTSEMLHKLITKLHNLQGLNLSYNNYCKELPENTSKLENLRMGEMLHLRYLDVSECKELEILPKSITELHNLQSLKLGNCSKLKELPEDTYKLVNLRKLVLYGCDSLTHMPAGMGKLTCLEKLTTFILSKDDDKKGKLRDLAALINNLSGDLDIRDYKYEEYLSSSTQLQVELWCLKLSCKIQSYHPFQETLVESLFCNHQFQDLEMKYYGGTKLPSFALGLVRIILKECDELQYLPSSLSQLCHLEYLSLESMKNLEYIESNAPSSSAKYFPALEELKLKNMPALKGWWRDIRWTKKEAVFIPSFPRLWHLYIRDCERLRYIPPCPFLTNLDLKDVNEALTFCKKEGAVQSNLISLNSLSIDNSCVFNSLSREFVGTIRGGLKSCSTVKHLRIWDCRELENLEIEHLNSLESLTLEGNIEGMPWNSVRSLSSLKLTSCHKVIILPKGIQYLTSLQSLILYGCDNLEDLGECFNSLTSLKVLQLWWCKKLIYLPEAMRHLTSLTTLEIKYGNELKSLPEAMTHLTSLTTLTIEYCPQLKSLPEAMTHLTSLTTLTIKYCQQLKSLPEAMRHLTSLTTLELSFNNRELDKRCRKPDGEDWSKICHIPNLHIL